MISRKGCSSDGRDWPNNLSQASDPIPITQERFPSISRKPTARSNAGRSPQSDRTAVPFAPPGLIVVTRKIAARVKARTTGCGTGGEPACALGVVNELDPLYDGFSNETKSTTCLPRTTRNVRISRILYRWLWSATSRCYLGSQVCGSTTREAHRVIRSGAHHSCHSRASAANNGGVLWPNGWERRPLK